MLEFNVSRGALVTEPMEGVYNKLAEQLWRAMDFWLTQQSVRGETTNDAQVYRMDNWNLLIPFFTDMGKREYEQMLQMPYDFFF